MTDGDWWIDEVRPEWAGHTWRALASETTGSLLAESRVWAEYPTGVLYVCASSLKVAYGFSVAVSQRAGESLRSAQVSQFPLAVGLLDELSVPRDPDPDRTEQIRGDHPLYSSVDSRQGYLYRYGQRLREAPLALLRLSTAADLDNVLDQIADHRYSCCPALKMSMMPALMVRMSGV